jgi:ATP-dependent RNA helicase RhlE
MFDFSKRLEDFETGKPTGGRGARGKYNREERAPRSGGFSGGRGGERKGFGPGHAPSRDGGATADRPAFGGGERRSYGAPARGGFGGGERTSFGAGAPGRTSYAGGSGRGGRPSFGGNGSSFGGRGGRSGGGRRLPPQPSYKQYMFTPTDDSGELKHTPYEVTKNFHEYALDDFIIKNIDKKGYEKPTEIQEKTLESIMAGQDMLGLANTGSGKTAAFLIPIVHRMLAGVQKRLLVMVPTRELADQVQTEFRWITHGTFLRSTVVVGGANARNQIMDIKRGVHCIVATPGRLKDLYDRGVIDFSDYGHVVLDEFDRMLDMGFINDIKEIMAMLPEDKQTVLFSATMSRDIERHVHSFLKNPAQVTIKSEPVGSRVAQEVVFYTTGLDKKNKLHDLLQKDKEGKYLIFTRTKREADRVSDDLRDLGASVDALHGDKSQNLRQRITNNFRTNKIRILIATDVAARGLDIPDVSHVINFDEPATREDYVHRIGRTARAGKQGTAYTFVKGGEY